MRILLIEDESDLATWLCKALEQSAFVVEWLNDGMVAEKILRIDEFDVVILDLGLPGKSGHAVLNTLRASGNRVPVLVLTARDTLEERVNCLNRGADDFVAKPFELAELEARLHALFRRSSGGNQTLLRCGPLTFDAHSRTFELDKAPIPLTPREHAMLSVLIHHTGEPVSKQRLLIRIFRESEDVGPDAIEVIACRLRKKLDSTQVRIVTVRGFGYSLECCTEDVLYA